MPNRKVEIIAEVGNLHNGSLNTAKKFIRAAADCGADIVKFQTHIFEAESLPEAPNPPYFKTESRKKYFERTAFNKQQWQELKCYAEDSCGIQFISSVFSQAAFDMLESIGVSIHKIPSGEVTNLPLLKSIALSGKKVFLSSGMSTWAELDRAVNTLKENGCMELVVFQCSSVYPCPPEKVGLNVLDQIRKRYKTEVGFSDHTLGCAAALAAIMEGARFIEKHFTLSKDMYGSDTKHSLTPRRFKYFVKEIRELEKMLAHPLDKDAQDASLTDMKTIFEKSIVSKVTIKKGETITFDILDFKKPGSGIRADRYTEIIGKVARVDIKANTQIKEEMLE